MRKLRLRNAKELPRPQVFSVAAPGQGASSVVSDAMLFHSSPLLLVIGLNSTNQESEVVLKNDVLLYRLVFLSFETIKISVKGIKVGFVIKNSKLVTLFSGNSVISPHPGIFSSKKQDGQGH